MNGSDKGLSPIRCETFIWTNDGFLNIKVFKSVVQKYWTNRFYLVLGLRWMRHVIIRKKRLSFKLHEYSYNFSYLQLWYPFPGKWPKQTHDYRYDNVAYWWWTTLGDSSGKSYHGPLTRYVRLQVAQCRERFTPPPSSKETDSLRSRHASRHARHARAVMHIGIAYPRWRGKRSRHSRCMRIRNFRYLTRSPWANLSTCLMNHRQSILSVLCLVIFREACIYSYKWLNSRNPYWIVQNSTAAFVMAWN